MENIYIHDYSLSGDNCEESVRVQPYDTKVTNEEGKKIINKT